MAPPGITEPDLVATLPQYAVRGAEEPRGAGGLARSAGAPEQAASPGQWAALDERFRQFADALPHVVWVASTDGRQLQFLNRAYYALFGRDPHEVLGDPAAVIRHIHPDDRKTVVRHHLQRGRFGSVVGECRYVGPDGSVRWGRYHVVLMRDGSGCARHRAGLFEDIHERKCREDALGISRAALAQAAGLSSIGAMAASVTHEITQPLCAIGNLAAACRLIVEAHPQWNATELHRCLSLMSAEIARARDIATRLRDFARRTTTRCCACDVNGILRESLALAAAELRLRNVAVAARIPAVPFTARVDAMQITQVVVQLLRNASDAVAGLPDPLRRVEVASQLSEGAIRVTISDGGPLVGTQDYGAWFEAFYTTRPNGLGLGLNICRALVEEHGGCICVEPNAPRGTKVAFTLPLLCRKDDP
jgi:PAS domain S-box-containing protein